ncbi:IS30 family transposase [Varunaivibrio sulfuroxidans]|uniref:IS30 family transposase n=1 Tax=Varunaivibrio sulfuroxidans TaxID=1773489 RepID=A0A4R3J5T2_9PROT|nr:IS30 family transposase [Varunaivibrio sulfuroxidans]TCS59770.1 IS30 family transposase [Varunaivibrio sulfuroxidans]WES30660.1 IS30 family transposase [Varunaivibrio sulfuroxidans]WES31745.1 IS30 family transposase [Varunaivibrio sulfuroxidans]WES31767.1 IS30 family transposase [Varunaivibrio sulfuroxidans]
MQKPPPMNDQKKAVIWDEWKNGIPMIQIARAIEKPPATIFSYLRYHGGIQLRHRIRSTRSLSLGEREEISRGVVTGQSIRSIASFLGRSASTVCREIKKNGGRLRYRAADADKAAWQRSKRPKPCLLAKNILLKGLVTRKVSENWSPEQISGWLKLTYPDDESLRVSPETIYKSLFIQTRGLFRKEMRNHLRTKRKFRHSKNHKVASRGAIVGGVSISERPALIEDRAVPGHWEGDLICGSKNSYIATVVERQSRFTVLVKVDGKDTETVVTALSKQMKKLPNLLRQSLTWDRGTELAAHRKFSMATNMDVYFCDPSSPWQRGTNENTNGLLRQYFPKGHCLSGYSQRDLNRVAEKLNSRPRKTLDFETPAHRLDTVLL